MNNRIKNKLNDTGRIKISFKHKIQSEIILQLKI